MYPDSARVRLIAIKLAGFKSFVDPVHIPVASQMVGVVGPNGCGKSNVIDAVRWVLGESQARHLRGASMADVIFNGSGARKPVSRASVELLFDNTDGSAPGAWSQYAELSVRRVLTRNGDSTYYINQTQVRRRDLLDVFLGTGLNARAPYAIIEQGMIARIIEARPEELRGFIEEAAGISRYKERRRETESRLEATRENLLRVEDVRRGLAEQMERLTAQAETAGQWRALQAELLLARQTLWLLKLRDATEKSRQAGARAQALEQEKQAGEQALALLHAGLASLRNQQDVASATLNQKQGALYAVMAEVSRLEQVVRHVAETRQRIRQQIGQGEAAQAQRDALGESVAREIVQWQERAAHTQEQKLACEQERDRQRAQWPAHETAEREARGQVAAAQHELAQNSQAEQVTRTHLQHETRAQAEREQRLQRLHQEEQGLAPVDAAVLQQIETRQAELACQFEAAERNVRQMRDQTGELEQQIKPLRESLERLRRELHRTEGELAGLTAAQRDARASEAIDGWLARHALADVQRLWQCLRVEPGWELAVQVALGSRLQALALDAPADAQLLADAPGGAVWFDASAGARLAPAEAGTLAQYVQVQAAGDAAVRDWLAGWWVASSVDEALALRDQLPSGVRCVTRDGHVLARYAAQRAGSSDAGQGVLERQRVIDALRATMEVREGEQGEQEQQIARLDATLAGLRQQLEQERSRAGRLQQERHQAQLEVERTRQQHERLAARREQIAATREELATALQAGTAERERLEARLAQQQAAGEQCRARLEQARTERQRLETVLAAQRQALQQSEKQAQEWDFSARLEREKLAELQRKQADLLEQSEKFIQHNNVLSDELKALDENTPAAELDAALGERAVAEQTLAEARNALEALREQLRLLEEERMHQEQQLSPLQAQLETARLRQQENTLLEAQCREELQQLDADEQALAPRLAQARAPALQGEIEQLRQRIDGLGAVNLLALDELEQARQRDTYLQAQCDDLLTAVATLEQAMAVMDQETRELFRATFDTVNASMAELFSTLFGGGQAHLGMTEGGWLEAGVQVMAQPPGKKNSSIHLLSGGEKTLTALSLVFALFRLNPAPFCLLDEVDAPLDDTNTERYARLVRQMSDSVQFLFITHNRITMEAATQLIGVTMQEPGVSRIVSVDLEQAERMVQQSGAVTA